MLRAKQFASPRASGCALAISNLTPNHLTEYLPYEETS
jgi:hypothetical protein